MTSVVNMEAPFPSSCALSQDYLRLHQQSNSRSFSSDLDDDSKPITYIPGNPAVHLIRAEIHAFLSAELETPLLDELYDWLWLVGRKSGRHIDALHLQRVKGRTIVPVEDPRLHLIWNRDKIYIKPVPDCLLNHDFWTIYLSPTSPSVAFDQSIVLGFLRSYTILISHRLDFIIARELGLIPAEVDWMQWSSFIVHFRSIGDESVAKRFHYGQLRLSRLDWAVRFFRPRNASTMWFYQIPYWSTTDFVDRATVPLAFVFASLSLVLSSMQVALAVPSDTLWTVIDPSGHQMGRAFWVFSVVVILLWGVAWIMLFGIPIVIVLWQILWGYRNR